MEYKLIIKVIYNLIIFLIIYAEQKNMKIKKKIVTAICLIAKEENKYIIEFAEHYKNLGIKRIILYDNNDINGENFEYILKKYIKSKFIKIINYRGLSKPQTIAYKNCYDENKNIYDWIGFYDVDEFLYITNYSNINDFLSLDKFKNCSSLLINWIYYGDNNNLYYEPKPLKERFTEPFTFSEKDKTKRKMLYTAGKTIVRGGINITWAHFPHFLNDPSQCRPDGSIIKEPFSPPKHLFAHIKHYTTKSTEEFAAKLKKGAVYSNNTDSEYYMKGRINYYYFFINKRNRTKIELLENKLNFKIK